MPPAKTWCVKWHHLTESFSARLLIAAVIVKAKSKTLKISLSCSPVYIKNTCGQAKSPVVKTGRQVSALTSGERFV